MPSKLLNVKQEARRSALNNVQEFFVSLAADMMVEEVYIVFDALDECLEKDRPEMIRLLVEIMAHLPCIMVFVESRREDDNEQTFTETSTPTIQIYADNIKAHIRNFAESQVRSKNSTP